MKQLDNKSIFSTSIVYLSVFFKRIHLNGFVSGLIFGALFSLVVNMFTVQIQEIIQKQRILEAVEYEILNNLLQAENIVVGNQKEIQESKEPNIFHTFSLYSADLWTQSTEPLQYIAQLDPKVQAQVVTYYSIVVKGQNELVNKLSNYADKILADCYSFSALDEDEKKMCNENYYDLLYFENNSADYISQSSLDLLDIFHPTKDRLENPILKFFMGGESVRILSRK